MRLRKNGTAICPLHQEEKVNIVSGSGSSDGVKLPAISSPTCTYSYLREDDF